MIRIATAAATLAALALGPGPSAGTADQPAGKQSQPHYCWLVCGPQAKVRALVRLDGQAIAIDRDGDGKFDGPGERFKAEDDCKDVVIADPDGKTSYVITYLHVMHVVPPEKFLVVRVHVRGALDYRQCCIVQMAAQRQGAPEARVHGPLKVSPTGWAIAKGAAGKQLVTEPLSPRSLNRAGKPSDCHVYITTEGKGSVVGVCSPDLPEKPKGRPAFPAGVHPFVDVEFPGKKPGDPPVKKRYALDEPAGDGGFRGPVRVPAKAGGGKAKLTFSFEAWKGAEVAPTTVELPVDAPREETK